jgi:hypothetical protein
MSPRATLPATASAATLAQQARFVFVGTIQKLHAANVAEVDDTKRTVIAHVEKVEKGPEAMAGFVGREITVKFAAGERVREGEQLRFFTNGWLFAETLAVESLGHETVAPEARRAAASLAAPPPSAARREAAAEAMVAREPASEPAARAKAAAIADRVADADVVVRGRVMAVRLTAVARAPRTATRAAAASGAAAAVPPRRPITEHDPDWREAVIEVDTVQKGPEKQQLVVRFPASDDVRWFRAPKFQPGQEGVFILQRTGEQPVAGAATTSGMRGRRTATAVEATDTFTALDPDDFQPSESEPVIRALVEPDEALGVQTTARKQKEPAPRSSKPSV